MHYYQFNLSDYITSTAHLTPMEDITYRRLLDFYYEKELPIPNETEWVSRRLRLVTEVETIKVILQEFFILTDDNMWIHDVCESNIQAYKKRCKTNKVNSLKGGRPKKTESVSNRNPIETLTNNQELITNNHKDQKKGVKRFTPPSLSDVKAYCAERNNYVNPQQFIDFYEAKGWMVGKNKMKSWQASVRTWESKSEQESKKPQFKNTINTGIINLGKEKNILPRPGESMIDYEQRVRQSR